jgi:hypothetical protein
MRIKITGNKSQIDDILWGNAVEDDTTWVSDSEAIVDVDSNDTDLIGDIKEACNDANIKHEVL